MGAIDGIESVQLIHQRIATWASEAPESTAVKYQSTELSYAQLDRRANQLAQFLQENHLTLGAPCAVLLEPCLDILTVVLAIFKCGATYVPLDPTHPKPRIQTIVEDVSPAIVLTRSHLLELVDGTGSTSETFVLDDVFAEVENLQNTVPEIIIPPETRAYIYFTSGTTGKPKGVMGSYANLKHYVDSACNMYRFSADDIMPAVARFTFSISMFELMMPLAAGGTVRILDRDHILNPQKMVATFKEVTFFHIGPSLLKSLLVQIEQQHLSPDEFKHVNHASSGGDMIPPELLNQLNRIFTSAEVYVIYGCSEVSCMGCSYPVPRAHVEKTYVGKPFPNMELVLLNESRTSLVEDEEIGEICFAGPGVVQGYLNHPQEASKNFITFEDQRFYCTGDMGRIDSTGNVEMLGRRDFQIKLRGIRIELAEVEFTLRKAPGVKDGLVSLQTVIGDSDALVAFVVLEDSDNKNTSAIRDFISEQLPDYMVPTFYMVLDKLPLNHNLKVDRKALPQASANDVPTRATVRSPVTDTERQLANIWQELLGIGKVGLDDNFFDLGGHSLLASEFIVSVESQLKTELDGMDVLRENLQVLAKICDTQLGNVTTDSKDAREINNDYQGKPLFFGPNQELYGVYFPGLSPLKNITVLVAPAIGSEWSRAHFIVRKVIEKLVKQGISVLRFDYFGTADSWGKSEEASLQRWRADLVSASAELRRLSGISNIVGLGIRLGGNLLLDVADQIELKHAILWDPIADGQQQLLRLRTGQKKLRQAFRHLTSIWGYPKLSKGEELLGVLYSENTVSECRKLQLYNSLEQSNVSYDVVLTNANKKEREELSAVLLNQSDRLIALGEICNWITVEGMEKILPDIQISSTIATRVNTYE